jgi:hypothetical protein
MAKKIRAAHNKKGELHVLRNDLGYQTEDEKIIDLLMRYCGDSSGASLTDVELKKVQNIISTDRHWQRIYEEIKKDYHRMIGSITASEIPYILTSAPRKGPLDVFWIKVEQILPFPSVRIAVGTVVLAVCFFGAASITSSVITPTTVPLAQLEPETLMVRGENDIPVDVVVAMQSGRYSEAITMLRAFSIKQMDSTTEASVDYLMGIALLHTAESSYGGPLNLFPHYHRLPVLDGIRYLQNALRISRTDDRRHDFQDACSFTLGKASLMLGDIKKAEAYFLQVNERNNPYRMPARIILSSLSR